jgi:pSer/pThr/pTyr-binding forkhead associated (FHA) protein
VRRGTYVYVSDLGLSTNGTRVNGRPVGRRVLLDGDVVAFGAARTRIGGVGPRRRTTPRSCAACRRPT